MASTIHPQFGYLEPLHRQQAGFIRLDSTFIRGSLGDATAQTGSCGTSTVHIGSNVDATAKTGSNSCATAQRIKRPREESNSTCDNDNKNGVLNVTTTGNSSQVQGELSTDANGPKLTPKSNLKKGEQKQTTFACKECDKTYSYSHLLKRHMRKHDGTKPYQCQTCGHRFRLYDAWKRHLLVHTGEKPLACSQCDRRFRDCSNLRQHMESHRTVNSFVCDTCGRAYKNARLLRIHSCRPVLVANGNAVHAQSSATPKTAVRRNSETNRRKRRKMEQLENVEGEGHSLRTAGSRDSVVCAICHMTFSHLADLEKHLIDTHNVDNVNNDKKVKTVQGFKCVLCQRKLTTLRGLNLHLLRCHQVEYDSLSRVEQERYVNVVQNHPHMNAANNYPHGNIVNNHAHLNTASNHINLNGVNNHTHVIAVNNHSPVEAVNNHPHGNAVNNHAHVSALTNHPHVTAVNNHAHGNNHQLIENDAIKIEEKFMTKKEALANLEINDLSYGVAINNSSGFANQPQPELPIATKTAEAVCSQGNIDHISFLKEQLFKGMLQNNSVLQEMIKACNNFIQNRNMKQEKDLVHFDAAQPLKEPPRGSDYNTQRSGGMMTHQAAADPKEGGSTFKQHFNVPETVSNQQRPHPVTHFAQPAQIQSFPETVPCVGGLQILDYLYAQALANGPNLAAPLTPGDSQQSHDLHLQALASQHDSASLTAPHQLRDLDPQTQSSDQTSRSFLALDSSQQLQNLGQQAPEIGQNAGAVQTSVAPKNLHDIDQSSRSPLTAFSFVHKPRGLESFDSAFNHIASRRSSISPQTVTHSDGSNPSPPAFDHVTFMPQLTQASALTVAQNYDRDVLSRAQETLQPGQETLQQPGLETLQPRQGTHQLAHETPLPEKMIRCATVGHSVAGLGLRGAAYYDKTIFSHINKTAEMRTQSEGFDSLRDTEMSADLSRSVTSELKEPLNNNTEGMCVSRDIQFGGNLAVKNDDVFSVGSVQCGSHYQQTRTAAPADTAPTPPTSGIKYEKAIPSLTPSGQPDDLKQQHPGGEILNYLTEDRKCFECKCGCTFSDNVALSLHQKIHNVEEILKCSVCEVKFESLQGLIVHFQSHEK